MAVVLDTHALIWYLSGSEELSRTARLAIQMAERNGDDVFISAISLIEIVYLAERGRLPAAALDRLGHALKASQKSLSVAPVDATVANALRTIPRDVVPDMPDRIIGATAVRLNAALITRDRRLHAAGAIRTAGLRIVW
jgi:PIN domain nuclease of toxin-antitoxin system